MRSEEFFRKTEQIELPHFKLFLVLDKLDESVSPELQKNKSNLISLQFLISSMLSLLLM